MDGTIKVRAGGDGDPRQSGAARRAPWSGCPASPAASRDSGLRRQGGAGPAGFLPSRRGGGAEVSPGDVPGSGPRPKGSDSSRPVAPHRSGPPGRGVVGDSGAPGWPQMCAAGV